MRGADCAIYAVLLCLPSHIKLTLWTRLVELRQTGQTFFSFSPDDQRWNTLGCMGDTSIETPNIDRLAKEGVLFKNQVLPAEA